MSAVPDYLSARKAFLEAETKEDSVLEATCGINVTTDEGQ